MRMWMRAVVPAHVEVAIVRAADVAREEATGLEQIFRRDCSIARNITLK